MEGEAEGGGFCVWLQTTVTEGERGMEGWRDRGMEGATVVPRASRTKATMQTVTEVD